MKPSPEVSPIAVGGLGGSGTRVVAQILQTAGLDIGRHLNTALDNLVFTNLLKNPRWRSRTRPGEVANRLRLFERCTTGCWSLGDLASYVAVTVRNRTPGTGGLGLPALLSARRSKTPARWGWKEPNTHIYLPELAATFPGIRYVHVLRNPLDMAFSSNLQQLRNWGQLFGVESTDSRGGTAVAQLEYALESNLYVIELGRRLLGERFRVLQFDRLHEEPEREVSALLDFAGIATGDPALQRHLIALVRRPRSVGRHLTADTSWLSNEHVAKAERLGYELLR